MSLQRIEKKLRWIEDTFGNEKLIKWQPFPGAQSMAFHCTADTLFYGGMPSGGKTDLILGLALTQHRRSLILRRRALDLAAIKSRFQEITQQQLGNESWINGRYIQAGGCKDEGTKYKYQGQAHDLKCVGAGTLVWMADGTRKPIELVQVGDRVMTLDGSRRVTMLYRQLKPAVLVKAFIDGQVVGSQVQSCSHELLLASGEWASHDMSFGAYHFAFSSPTRPRFVHKFAEWSLQTSGLFSSNPSVRCLDQGRLLEQFQCLSDYQAWLGLLACKGEVVQESDCGLSCDAHLAFWQHLLLTRIPLEFLSTHLDRLGFWSSLQQAWHDGFCVPSASSQPDWKDGYLFGSDRGDEQLHQHQAVVLLDPLQSSDAEERSPNDLLLDDQGIAPRHTRYRWSYVHPYTKEIRQTDLVKRVPCSVQCCEIGESQLFDLTVEDSNHYITGAGFVNRNCFDEITQFTQTQYEYIKTWNRTADPHQRCRTVCTFNPPTSPEQRWVLTYLAPWLDPRHSKPAASGETRFYVLGDEVDSPDPVEVNGKLIKPVSRCFILSSIADNPLMLASGYDRILDNLPPELQGLTDFSAGIQDNPYQVIPTKWVELAQERWRSRNLGDVPSIIPQDAIAGDPARGGADETAIAIRHGDWINCWSYPGKQTPDGITGATKLLMHRQGNSRILLDVIGIGSAVQDTLKLQGHEVTAVIASASSYSRTRSGQFGFANKRAEMWWRLREALDPAYLPTLALPPHPQLLGDLTAPRWNLTLKGILVNSKDEIRCTLGRSTNVGDAVVMVCDLGSMSYQSAF